MTNKNLRQYSFVSQGKLVSTFAYQWRTKKTKERKYLRVNVRVLVW